MILILPGCINNGVEIPDPIYNIQSCGTINPKIDLIFEDPDQHAGTERNQMILVQNLIKIKQKYDSMIIILQCYENQLPENKDIIKQDDHITENN